MRDINKIQPASSNIEVDLCMCSSALGEKKCVDGGFFECTHWRGLVNPDEKIAS